MWTVGRIRNDTFSAFNAMLVSFGRHNRGLSSPRGCVSQNSRTPCLASKHSTGKLLFFRNVYYFAWQKMPCSNRTSTLNPSLYPFLPPSFLTKYLVSGNCFVGSDKKGEVRPKTSLIFRTRRRKSRARLNILLMLSLSLPSLLCIVRCVVAGILAMALDASSEFVP